MKYLKKNLTITFLLIFFVSSTFIKAQKWKNEEFIIGTYYDPPLSGNRDTTNVEEVSKDMASLQKAKNAGFNLLTGLIELHEKEYGTNKIKYYPQYIANRVGLKYFIKDSRINCYEHPTESSAHAILNEYNHPNYRNKVGFNIKDEPLEKDSSCIREWINYIKKHNASLLPFVNLFPYYYYDNWDSYQKYLNIYATDSTRLPVICYDNYAQYENWGKYYSNLSFLRCIAGNRPLWCYIRTSEATMNMDSLKQASYIRLGAFAPIAYGAKGLLYYSYDRVDPDKIIIDYDYHNSTGWDESAFFDIEENQYDFFVGHFKENSTGRADFAIKSDTLLGTWYIKYAQDSNNQATSGWDKVLTWYGDSKATISQVFDWNLDGKDDLIALTNEGYLLIDNNLGGWDYSVPLLQFPINSFSQMNSKNLVVGKLNKFNGIDMCFSWGDTIQFYFDYDNASNTFKRGTKKTYLPSTIQLIKLQSSDIKDTLFAVKRGENDSILLFSSNIEAWSKAIPIKCKIQNYNIKYYWIEQNRDGTILFYCRDKDGNIWRGNYKVNQDSINLDTVISSHSSPLIYPFSVKNKKSNTYDMYGVYAKDFLTDALFDKNQRPTRLYDLATKINHYIKNNLAPIVMNCTWRGTYHTKDNIDNEYMDVLQTISDSTPYIKKMSENLLVGIFQKSDSCCFLLVVNKAEKTRAKSHIYLKGNYQGRVTQVARINNENIRNNVLGSFCIDSMFTEVILNDLQGGECAVLKLDVHDSYFKRHRNSHFTSSNLADIHMRFPDQTWKISYSSNGFKQWDVNLPEYGADQWSKTVAADYDGDKKTDLSILVPFGTYVLWYIDYSSNGFNGWDKSFRYDLSKSETNPVPFNGDYDGDGCYDICFRTDDGTMHIDYSRNEFGQIDKKLYLYGQDCSTIPACGDFDGDYLDDIGLLYQTSDSDSLLIDYSSNKLGRWDLTKKANVQTNDSIYHIQSLISDYDGDNMADFCLYLKRVSKCHIDLAYNGFGIWDIIIDTKKDPNSIAMSSDYDGDGIADLCFYNNGVLLFDYAKNGFGVQDEQIEINEITSKAPAKDFYIKKSESNNIDSSISLHDTTSSDIKIYSSNKKIIIEATSNKDKVYLFNSIGVLTNIVRTPLGRTEIPVLTGSYVAWYGKKVFKLIVE